MNEFRWHDETGTGAPESSFKGAGARYRARLALYPERRPGSNLMRVAREIVRALWRPPARAEGPARDGGRTETGPAPDLSAPRAERN